MGLIGKWVEEGWEVWDSWTRNLALEFKEEEEEVEKKEKQEQDEWEEEVGGVKATWRALILGVMIVESEVNYRFTTLWCRREVHLELDTNLSATCCHARSVMRKLYCERVQEKTSWGWTRKWKLGTKVKLGYESGCWRSNMKQVLSSWCGVEKKKEEGSDLAAEHCGCCICCTGSRFLYNV